MDYINNLKQRSRFWFRDRRCCQSNWKRSKIAKNFIIVLRFYDGIRFIKVLITLGASFIENLLTCKIVKTKILGHRLIRVDEETIIAAQVF